VPLAIGEHIPARTRLESLDRRRNRRKARAAALPCRPTPVEETTRKRAFARAALAVSLLVSVCAWPAGALAAGPGNLEIRVISNRADLISGDDALVSIGIPRGVRPSQIRVKLNGSNVTSEFAVRANGSYEGMVEGLDLGRNLLVATASGADPDRAVIRNHPIGGPVFSGPQVQPWVCRNGSTKPKCEAPITYEYQYKSSVDGGLHPYDPDNPPSDLAQATTQTGETVPFIIRIETGYQDRDQYKIAVLDQPDKGWEPWDPQPQFNHKLLITHGASCGIDHQSGDAPSVTGDTLGSSSPTVALGMGFAVMSTALNNAGHNCNLATEAESMVMAKEHLIESYGTLKYTIGTGCSGGSLVQQQVANAYPGIYQGILPQCSFPDSWSTGQQLAAYHFDRGYFENPSKWGPGIVWTPTQIAAVEGHPNHVNSIVFDSVYWTSLADPSDGCPGVPSSDNYDSQTNPDGVRCTLADYMINVLGPRPQSLWTPAETEIGRGFAGLPIGDVGVQFGLKALERGDISPAQFVDLNAKIGGADIDLNPTAARSDATQPALRNVYRSGGVNETNNLTGVAIIDLRGPDPGAFHDAYRSWTIRARLEREEGHFPRNHVIWFGQTPLIGDPRYTTEGLKAMDRWLSAVQRDDRNLPLATKVARDRPADVHDQCSSIPGVEKVSVPDVGPVCKLKDAQTRFGTPATVAGESIATDQNRCQLKPLRRSDYYPIDFTQAQWTALRRTFPTGVCDWERPGVSQTDTVPWLTYQTHDGQVVFGGQRLGAAPDRSGGGWTSRAFSSWSNPSG
jgi:Tannase-like family of unknown function (DUF6351)